MNSSMLERFAPALTGAHPPLCRDERLLLARDGEVASYYAPFEWSNEEAKVVLVGITPGPTQMRNALEAARRALLNGQDPASALAAAKQTAGFSGEPLRSNLVAQLNHWGLHTWLGLSDTAHLFGAARNLLHTTSLLQFPVFVGGQPYRGTPDMLSHRLLKAQLFEYFVAEVERLRDAVFLGLGPTVHHVLDVLVRRGALPRSRVLSGLSHPSGNSTYRVRYLVGARTGPLPHATSSGAYDRGRLAFQAAVGLGHL